MRKRKLSLALSIMLAIALVFTMMPISASAAQGVKVSAAAAQNVYVSYSDGEFPIAKQQVSVYPGLAKDYGYSYGSNVKSTDITALDALVAAHILIYGEDKDEINDNLVVSEGGGATKFFGNSSWNFTFFVNGEQPSDKSIINPADSWGPASYLMYAPNQAVIAAGDHVQFHYLQASYGDDNYVWFENNSQRKDRIIATPEEELTLVVKGFCNWYCAAVDRANAPGFGPIEGAVLVPVDIDTTAGWNVGSFGNDIARSNDDGELDLTVETSLGTYVYSVYDDGDYEIPIISPWFEVVVVEPEVKVVVDAIDALPSAPAKSDVAAVNAAATAYNALTSGQKQQVPADIKAKLDLAVQKADIVDRTRGVSFNANGGTLSGSTSKSVLANEAYGALPTAARTGHTFAGWYTAKSGGTKVTASSTVTAVSDHTLHAQWTPNKYTLKFNANGGKTKTTSKTVIFDSAYGSLPTPTKSLKSFKGWYTAKSGGTKITASTKHSVAKNLTVYAHWANAKAKVVKCKTVSLRKGPGTNYKKVSYLKKGNNVEILAESGGWYKVKYGKKTGWIYGKYIGK